MVTLDKAPITLHLLDPAMIHVNDEWTLVHSVTGEVIEKSRHEFVLLVNSNQMLTFLYTDLQAESAARVAYTRPACCLTGGECPGCRRAAARAAYAAFDGPTVQGARMDFSGGTTRLVLDAL